LLEDWVAICISNIEFSFAFHLIADASASIHDYHNDLDRWTRTDKPESHVFQEPLSGLGISAFDYE
jgi:hypothetical protein